MPLTFPSHAAALLPLLHLRGTRRLPVAALVAGSTAPDLIYLTGLPGAAAHLPPGLFTFCLPAGLLTFLYLEGLLLPVVAPLLPTLFPAPRLARLVAPRALPKTGSGWLAVGLAVLLGAVTHQLWDGFTHAWMWPARVLYPGVSIPLFGRPVLLSKFLQHLSSAVGVLIVILYVVHCVTPLPTGAPPTLSRPHAVRRVLYLVLPSLLGGLAAAALRMRHPHPLHTRAIWEAAWSGAAGFGLILGAACLILRCSDGRGARRMANSAAGRS